MHNDLIWRPSPAALERLRDAARVLPVLGAGINVPARLPDAPSLTRQLIEEHPLAASAELSAPGRLQQVADDLAQGDRERRRSVNEFVAERLKTASRQASPPATLRSLVRTPSRWLVTLNYDLLAEAAAVREGVPYKTSTWRDLPPFEVHPGPELNILHLHGSVEDPDSLVLDSVSYAELQNNAQVAHLLGLLLGTHSACFIGTTMDEPVLLPLLLSWRSTRSKPAHVFVSDEATKAGATQGRGGVSASAHGVLAEAFPDGAFDLLDEFCEFLVTLAPEPERALLPAGSPSGAEALAGGRSSEAPDSTLEVVAIHSAWGPSWTRAALTDLLEHEPAEMAALQAALEGSAEPAVVEELVTSPPAWLSNASEWAWCAVARFAEQQGSWTVACLAWLQAEERSESDATRHLVAAASAADMAHDTEGARRLRQRAEAADPAHPRVRLARVGQLTTFDAQLEALRALQDEADEQVRVLANAYLAMAYQQLRDMPQAQRHLDVASSLRPDMLQTRMARVVVEVGAAGLRLVRGARIDTRALDAARADAVELRTELAQMARWDESATMLVASADAAALLGNRAESGQLLDTAHDEERGTEGGRVRLAEAALRAGQADVAGRLLEGAEPSGAVTVMQAQMTLANGSVDEQLLAMETLDAVVAAGGEDALRAAGARISGAYRRPEAGWNAEAATVMREAGNTEAAVSLQALWMYKSGDETGATELLRPHADQVWAWEIRLQLAVWEGDKAEAAETARHLLAMGPDHHTRIMAAQVLAEGGLVEEAKSAARVVTDDPSATRADRALAFNALTTVLVVAESRFADALDYARRWADDDPEDERAAWVEIDMLTRLGRFADANHRLRVGDLTPATVMQGRIAARTVAHLTDPVEALDRLLAIRARLPSSDEDIDHIIAVVRHTRIADGALSPELEDAAKAVPFGALRGTSITVEALHEMGRARAQRADQALREVETGRAPTANLAFQTGMDVAQAWHHLDLRPAGFGDPAGHELEVEAATAALGAGAIIDPTALYTLVRLGHPVRTRLKSFEAVLRTTQATVDDLTTGHRSSLGPRSRAATLDAGDGTMGLSYEPVLAVVAATRVEPDTVAEHTGPYDDLCMPPIATPTRVWAATLGTAGRTGLPVFSDDRVIRAHAIAEGATAFGTPALLDALARAGSLTAPQLYDARNRLRVDDYLGVQPDDGEFIYYGSRVQGLPPAGLVRIWRDRAFWAANYRHAALRSVRLLRDVYVARPAELSNWTGVLVDAMVHAVPSEALGVRERAKTGRLARIQLHTEWLLALALCSRPNDRDERAFVAALRSTIRTVQPTPATPGVLIGATDKLLSLVERAGLPRAWGATLVLAFLPAQELIEQAGVSTSPAHSWRV